ncbi:MAG: methylenetetrahydrofolate reductase [Chloroflexi bacterium]|nr:methylenetetrahydrofolate reductase [Chloroflexota bacterium]
MYVCEIIKQAKFLVTCELEPPKGIALEGFLNRVEMLKGSVHAINIGDNQRAVMRAAALAVCHTLKTRSIEPVMEIAARDKNRIAIQSELLGAAILGIENILLVTGQEPVMGDHREARPVYDLDGVALVDAAIRLTRGKDLTGHDLTGSPAFCLGIVATPGLDDGGARLAELEKKVAAGARFIQTPPVYEPAVFEKFIRTMARFEIPVLAGHTILKSASMAGFMNSNIEGVHVPENIIRELEGLTRKELIDRTLRISLNILREIKPMCQGVHFITAGWEGHIPTLVRELAA